METRFLETFVMVVQHGSLAEASRRLAITPAAVAQRMQALEEEIGADLLIRSGRRVRPTQAGHAILAQARRIVTDVRHLRGLAATDAPSGELRLGAISTALTGLLPAALRQIFTAMPQVEVFVLPGTSADLYQHLVDGAVDAAIMIKPPFAILKSLEWRLLRSEPLVLLCPAAVAGEDPHALLRSRPFIRYDRNNWGGRLADEYLRRTGIAAREWLELDSLEAIAVMVSNGLGVSLVPSWAPPWPEGVAVAQLALPEPSPPREIGLLWPRGAPSSRLVNLIGDAIDPPASSRVERRAAEGEGRA